MSWSTKAQPTVAGNWRTQVLSRKHTSRRKPKLKHKSTHPCTRSTEGNAGAKKVAHLVVTALHNTARAVLAGDAADGDLLAGGDSRSILLRSLLDITVIGHADDLNVCWAGHVRVDATVGTVGAAAHVGGVVDLDVLDHHFLDLEAAVLGVGHGVLEQVNEHAGGFFGPATLGAGRFLVLGLQWN